MLCFLRFVYSITTGFDQGHPAPYILTYLRVSVWGATVDKTFQIQIWEKYY